jgi:phosphoadenosine phosphosulfate reductase
MPTVGWCEPCNVPILDARRCGICHTPSSKIRFTKAELRPISKEEMNFYRKALAKTGVDIASLFPKGTVFHNIMGELIADGKKVLRISYDEGEQNWKARFFKDMLQHMRSFEGSDLQRTIRANQYILEEKEAKALRLIRKAIKRYADLPVAVSFSGGKDSTVTLALMRKIKRRPDVIFLNTTIEFDQTVRYVHRIARLWKVRLLEARPPHDFLDLCWQLGPPSKMMKWCCKTQKFSPQNQLINERYPRGVLVFSGIRKSESNARSGFRTIQRNKMIPKQTLAFPILDWTSLDVWLYILGRGIPYNEMYRHGFARVGCWACPEKSLRDLALLEEVSPTLFGKLRNILYEYAVRAHIQDPEGWIRTGKWRSRRTKWLKTVACSSSQLCSIGDQTMYTFTEACDMNRVKEFLRVFGSPCELGSVTRIDGQEIEITIIGQRMRVKTGNPELLLRLEKQLARALNCVGCGACVGICPVGALRIEGGRIKIGPDCIRCLRCVTANGIRMSCVSVNYKPEIMAVA